MKIAVTGHTRGLGKALYEWFLDQGHEVLGFSKSNGFDISTNTEELIQQLSSCDLVINNAHVKDFQAEILEKIVNKVDKVIVIGSSLHQFRDIATFDYVEQKHRLSQLCKKLNVNPNITTNILHINIAFLPNDPSDQTRLLSDNVTEYSEVINLIQYWLSNPILTDITFNWKLTPFVVNQLGKIFKDLKIDLF